MRRKKTEYQDHPAHWGLALAGVVLALPSLPELRPLLVPVFVIILFGGVISLNAFERRKQRALALRDLSTVSPHEFELHMAQVLSALPGWKAEATRGSGD